ncbi:MAG: hypothetical protein V1688_02315, partial [bacterium]
MTGGELRGGGGGRSAGTPPHKNKGKPKELLTKKQLDEIVKTIKEKTPRDFGYNTDYWTTGIVGAVIE